MLEMKLEISSKNGLHTLYSYYFLLSDNKTFYQKYPQNIFLVDFFYHVFTVVEIFWLSRRYSFYSFFNFNCRFFFSFSKTLLKLHYTFHFLLFPTTHLLAHFLDSLLKTFMFKHLSSKARCLSVSLSSVLALIF